jgi:hypothetical protein
MKEPRGRMRFLLPCRIGAILLCLLSAAWAAHAAGLRPSTSAPATPERAILAKYVHRAAFHNQGENSAGLAEESRGAGLLTDWHLLGCYGHGPADFARHFAPERWAANEAAQVAAPDAKAANADAQAEEPTDRHFRHLHYELLFPEGKFVLPPAQARRGGVFYAVSRVYLSDGGDWNVYLESGARAVVFVDGSAVLTSGVPHIGTLRATVHAESGYHMVMVKFVAQSAPFRVAILPPNSGSRRKSDTPYLGGPENMDAGARGPWPSLPERARPAKSSFKVANIAPAQIASSKEITLRRSAASANFSLRRLSVAKTWLARCT